MPAMDIEKQVAGFARQTSCLMTETAVLIVREGLKVFQRQQQTQAFMRGM